MDWFRKLKAFFSILLIAWNQTRRPEPFKPEEGPDETDQPHTHQEALEPEESGAYEEQDQGGGVTTLKPRLIFGNSFANLLQCRIHNGGFLSSELPIHGPDVRVILTEGFHRSFRSGDRIRLQFGPVGGGVSLIAPIEVPLEAYTTEALAKSPKSPRPLPSGAPGYRPGKLRMLATDPEGNTLPGVKLTHTAKPGLAQILIMKTEACAVYETVASEALAVGDAVKRTSIEIHVAFFSNTNQDLPTPGQTKLIVTYIPNPKTFAHGSTGALPYLFQPHNLFAINTCRQALMFPFVTNQDGSDTRIVISNTSLDIFGTSTQQGAVRLYFYGSMADGTAVPSGICSQKIPAGMQLVFNLSSGGNFGLPPVPGFQGYLLAETEFEYCLGLALIKDGQGSSYSYKADQMNRHPERP